MSYEQIVDAADVIKQTTGREAHHVAAVLGSGLGSYAAELPGAVEIPYDSIPGFPKPRVEGHAGSLFSAELEGVRTLIFSGRVHYYEGWPMDKVVFGVRAAVTAGCSTVLLTNACGGVADGLEAGDLVLIRDHINLAGANPLMGQNDPRLGPRFPDMTNVYDADLRARALQVAGRVGVELKEGVYAWLTGPSYESPAEIEMVKRIGGDLVGMSTVPEAIAIRHMGARVLGISLVTNLAAGISPTPLSHEEVTEVAGIARNRFSSLVTALLPALID